MGNVDKILVIVVTYNGMFWLERCLDSVVGSSVPLDLFVVDNGSTDGSSQYIEKNYPMAKLIRSGKNLGFGAANNMGIEYAIEQGYDYIYLLNQDAWLKRDTVEKMVRAQKRDRSYGILSPMQMYGDGMTIDRALYRSVERSTKVGNDLSNEIMDVKFVMAAHWLVSRECFTQVGLFSPIFYHYGEDNNYIHRARYFRFKVGLVPRAQAIHDRAMREITLDQQLYMIQNSLLKHSSNINFNYFSCLIYCIYIVVRDSMRLAYEYRDPSIFFKIALFDRKIYNIYCDRSRNKRPFVETY